MIDYSVDDSRILLMKWIASCGPPTMALSKIWFFMGALVSTAAGPIRPRCFSTRRPVFNACPWLFVTSELIG